MEWDILAYEEMVEHDRLMKELPTAMEAVREITPDNLGRKFIYGKNRVKLILTGIDLLFCNSDNLHSNQ